MPSTASTKTAEHRLQLVPIETQVGHNCQGTSSPLGALALGTGWIQGGQKLMGTLRRSTTACLGQASHIRPKRRGSHYA